jgi:hypothetical protein
VFWLLNVLRECRFLDAQKKHFQATKLSKKRNAILQVSRFVNAQKTRFQATKRHKREMPSPGEVEATKRSKKSNAILQGRRFLMLRNGISGDNVKKKKTGMPSAREVHLLKRF